MKEKLIALVANFLVRKKSKLPQGIKTVKAYSIRTTF